MKGFCRIAILIGIILMISFAQAEEQTETFHVDIGSFVTFGRYEQDGNPDNGTEKIEWIVLDVQDGKCLLLSRYCLDSKPYHSKGKTITWKDSALRKWLNSDFLDSAFLPAEQEVFLLFLPGFSGVFAASKLPLVILFRSFRIVNTLIKASKN